MKNPVIVAMAFALVCGSGGDIFPETLTPKLRDATVSEGLEMTTIASPVVTAGTPPCVAQFYNAASMATFSPNGKRFVIVLRRGDVSRNLIDYTMLLGETTDSGTGTPRPILQMSSSSLRAAIDSDTISWSRDSNSLTFLGERPGGHHNIYELNVTTGSLKLRAAYPGGDIISYSRDARGDAMAYDVALKYEESLWNAQTARHGLAVTWQSLSDVESGVIRWHTRPQAALLVQSARGTKTIQPPAGSFFPYSPEESQSDRGISMSPNGRYIVLLATIPVGKIPNAWQEYRDPWVEWTFGYLRSLSSVGRYHTQQQSFDQSDLERYVVVDVVTGRIRVLLDSPVAWMQSDPVVWAPDSRSVVLSDVLEVIGANEGGGLIGASTRKALEIDLATGAVRRVGGGCKLALSWRKSILECGAEPSLFKAMEEIERSSTAVMHGGFSSKLCRAPLVIGYRKVGGEWQAVDHVRSAPVSIFARDGLNFPPKLYYEVRGRKSGELLDLNPQFTNIRLAREEVVTWDWSKGRSISAGLYIPPRYRPGERYPLVIQTHTFVDNEFNYFGGLTTASAAQPLAARGMFVLQVNDIDQGFLSAKSASSQLQAVDRAIYIYTSAITYLSKHYSIDPSRVGIIGFSNTCFFVDWALTHDPKLFAAASVSEGADGSYLEYMTYALGEVAAPSLYVGPPFGRYLQSWFNRSPIFNVDRVRAPLLIGVDHNWLADEEWEWFGGLKHLGRPVYMFVLDGRSNDSHLLQKPWDRLISSGENVDWFDFWLNGHESTDPDKAAQYAQWRQLRVMLRENAPSNPISWARVD
jgi:Prolyl oligopeptidase family/WD40-like Beta Propeller Repeat